MKLTLQLQLLPDPDQTKSLLETMERFNEAANWVAERLFERKLANRITAQQLFYHEIRAKFKLSAQATILSIHRAVEAYKRDKTIRPEFKPHSAITYDPVILSFKGLDRVSIWTLNGRVIVPMLMGKYQKERFNKHKGQSDLYLRQDGKWFLLVQIDVPDNTPYEVKEFIGVDLGIVNLAVDSTGEIFSGQKVEDVRQKHHQTRRRLQQRGTKGAKKRLKRLSGKEARFRRHTNHVISKKLVAKAKDTQQGLALEDLKGIRNRTEKRLRKQQRARHSSWAFSQLRTFIEYKAQLAGVPVVIVNPAYSSQTCPRCGYCGKRNRKSQSEFECLQCGLAENADFIGAINLASWAVTNPALELVR